MQDRLLWLDLIRAVSAQLIVLHHLALYGPIAEHLAGLAPETIGWLREYARIAVQVFLVMSGFLVARRLRVDHARSARSILASFGQRYLRLFVPFLAALGLVLLAAWPARRWATGDWIPAAPDASVLLVHLLGLYDYLGMQALTAGAWYVTIDLQLHGLVLLIVWVAGRIGLEASARFRALTLIVSATAALSLLFFNRDPSWDVMPLYFFGSFALGMAAAWLGRGGEDQAVARLAGAGLFCLALLALLVDYRLRVAISLASAVSLWLLARGLGQQFDAALRASPAMRPVRDALVFLGDIAYALFLVHFPLCLLMNALYQRYAADIPGAALVGFVLAWLFSLPLAALLHRFVEIPLQRRSRG